MRVLLNKKSKNKIFFIKHQLFKNNGFVEILIFLEFVLFCKCCKLCF